MIRKANLKDVNDVFDLIASDPKHLIPRSIIDIRGNIGNFLVYEIDDRIIGCVSLEKYTSKIAEVRSLYVDSQYRLNHIGKQLVEEVIKLADEGQEVFTVTSELTFFLELGFKTCLGEKYILFVKK